MEFGIAILSQSLSTLDNIELVGTATSAEEGEEHIMNLEPDLLFLDIELPGINGLEFLRLLRFKVTWSMQVIMYSSHSQFVLDSFREYAFDVLLKPYDQQGFLTVMERFFAFQFNQDIMQQIKSKPNISNTKIMITTLTGVKITPLSEIGYFLYNKDKRQWTVVLLNKKRIRLKTQTKAENILADSAYFFKINHFQIININFLSEILEYKCTLLPPFDNEPEFIISRTALKSLQNIFSQI
jgi:two-component system LytT family response regulator